MEPDVPAERRGVRVRVLAAGFRADVIDHATAVFQQERAGGTVHHRVAVLVHDQVGFRKGGGFQVKGLGDTADVRLVDDGRDAGAAAGAIQAIDPGKNLAVDLVRLVVQVFSLVAFQPADDFRAFPRDQVFPFFPRFDGGWLFMTDRVGLFGMPPAYRKRKAADRKVIRMTNLR